MLVVEMQGLIVLDIRFDKLGHSRVQSAQFCDLKKLDVPGPIDHINDGPFFDIALAINQSFHSQTDAPNGEVLAVDVGLFGQIHQQFYSFHVLGLFAVYSFGNLQETGFFFFLFALEQRGASPRDQKSV